MENNEIMNPEMVEEATETLTENGYTKTFPFGLTVGVAAIAGALAWEFAVKPLVKKGVKVYKNYKAKKMAVIDQYGNVIAEEI